MNLDERQLLTAKVEAILFASADPIKITEIIDILKDPDSNEEISPKLILEIINEIDSFHSERHGGFSLVSIKPNSYQFQTTQAVSSVMERMFSNRPRPLSRAAQETLAIIAYRQPVTRADIEFIRGVDAGSIMKNLLERGLIQCTGRKEDSGRPMLFGTTQEFLRVYRLASLSDLPPLESFQPAHAAISRALSKIADDPGANIDMNEFVDPKREEVHPPN